MTLLDSKNWKLITVICSVNQKHIWTNTCLQTSNSKVTKKISLRKCTQLLPVSLGYSSLIQHPVKDTCGPLSWTSDRKSSVIWVQWKMNTVRISLRARPVNLMISSRRFWSEIQRLPSPKRNLSRCTLWWARPRQLTDRAARWVFQFPSRTMHWITSKCFHTD